MEVNTGPCDSILYYFTQPKSYEFHTRQVGITAQKKPHHSTAYQEQICLLSKCGKALNKTDSGLDFVAVSVLKETSFNHMLQGVYCLL